MKAVVIGAFIVFFGLSLFAQTEKHIATDNPQKTLVDVAVQQAAAAYLQDSNANGIAIGLYIKGKKYTYNYGETTRGSGQLPTANTIYNLGSVAKTFVTTMLAKAVIDKRVKLTDDIRKYLPNNYPNLAYKGHPIRFIDLANHTSGLPRQFHQFPASTLDSLKQVGRKGEINYYNGYTQQSLLADLHKLQPDTIPGYRFEYNGNGMMLLILLLERIYHKPYEKIVSQYLGKHLKMYNTKTVLTDNDMKRLAQGYNTKNEPQEYVNYTGFTGGPSMNSTINDMLKYLGANIEEKDKALKLTHQLTWGDKHDFAMGLGWMIGSDENGEQFIFHDGHTGVGFNTHCIFYPKEQLGFIIIVNDLTSQDKVTELEKRIKQAISKY